MRQESLISLCFLILIEAIEIPFLIVLNLLFAKEKEHDRVISTRELEGI
jgi:hypothetical protein